MATHSTVWFGIMSTSASSLAAGQPVVKSGDVYLPATAANRALYGRSVGIAKTAADLTNKTFEYQVAGVLSAALSGVGTGTAGDSVIVTAGGALQRTASPGGSDDIIGKCPGTSGDVVVTPCASLGGGNGSNVGAKLEVFKDVDAGTLRHRTIDTTGDTAGKSGSQDANVLNLRPCPPGVRNPCDYGATASSSNVWDSVQDDTAFLQAAIDAHAKGGHVHIPPGNYFITAPLRTKENGTTIAGCGANPGNLDHSTVIHAVAAMDAMIIACGRCEISNLLLDCRRNANYGLARNTESLSFYKNLYIFEPKIDGIHSYRVKDDWTISAVTQTGSGPAVTVAGNPAPYYGGLHTVEITTGGALGTGEFTIALDVLGGTPVGPFVIPTSGVIQVPLYIGGYSIGLLLTFASGTYQLGTTYEFESTILATINDASRFQDCRVHGAGCIYATGGFTGGVRPLSELTNRTLNYSAAAGTVAIAAGSQTVTGTGTSFLATGARPGDWMRVGAYPSWAASESISTGDFRVPSNKSPGQAYVWRAQNNGTTGATQPDWPVESEGTTGSMPIFQGVGVTVDDNGIVWEVWNPIAFQILNVLDDETITIGTDGKPIKTQSGLDYAVHVGSGFFEELSSDANTCVIDNCVFNSCAAFGICSTADYGDKVHNGQCSDNGIGGISLGIANNIAYDVSIFGTYMEGNLCANIAVVYASGCNFVSPMMAANTCQHVYDVGNINTRGVWHGGAGYDYRVAQPVGTGAFSTVPVTWTALNKPFHIRGPEVRPPNEQIGITLATQIDPDLGGSFVRISTTASGYFSVGPAIKAGQFNGQVIEIYNAGTNWFGFDAATNSMNLEDDFIVVESLQAVRFYWNADFSKWRQLGSVGGAGNFTVRPFDWTGLVSNGANTNLACPIRTKIDITAPTAAFSIGGIDVPPRDGHVIEIVNRTTQTMTISHEAGAATAAERIVTITGADVALAPVAVASGGGYSYARLIYDANAARWLLTASRP